MSRPNLIILAVAALVALLSTTVAQAQPAFANREVNVRSGPGLNFEVVDRLVLNAPVEIVSCNPDRSWCSIRHEGNNGWVAAVFLTPAARQPGAGQPGGGIPPGGNQPGGATPPPQTGSAYLATSQVNVRSGPGTQFGVVDRLTANQRVTRGQCTPDGGWCYVTHSGTAGWVSASFLRPVAPTPPLPPAPTPGGNQGGGVITPAPYVATSSVNVRSGPGLTFGVVGRLNSGERVMRMQCLPNGTWCYVDGNRVDGWVSADFLRSADFGGRPTPIPAVRTATAITGMPVRSDPALFSATVGRLERGQTVDVDRCTPEGEWCHVVGRRLDGWVLRAFLDFDRAGPPEQPQRPQPPRQPQPEPEPEDIEAVVTSTIALREGPGQQFRVIGVVRQGEDVVIEQCNRSGDWCEIQRGAGSGGWISAAFLDVPDRRAEPAQPRGPNAICFTGFGGIEICLTE